MFIIQLNDRFTHVPLAILTGYNNTHSLQIQQWKPVTEIMLNMQI